MTEVSVFCLVGEATNLVRHQSSTSASVKATHSPLESSTVKARSTGCLISLMARCSKGACAIAPPTPSHRGKMYIQSDPPPLYENGLWMFRKKITESDAFIVRAHFNIQTIIGTIFFGKIHGCLIIRLANRTTFSIQRMPRLVNSS